MKTFLITFAAVLCLTFSSNAQTIESILPEAGPTISSVGPDVPPGCWKIGTPIKLWIGDDGCIEADCKVVLGVCCIWMSNQAGSTYLIKFQGNEYYFDNLEVLSEEGDVHSYRGCSINN